MISLVNKELKLEAIKNNNSNNVYIDIKDISELVKDSSTRNKIITIGANIGVFILILFVFFFVYFFREELTYGHQIDNNQTIVSNNVLPYNFFKKI